MKFTDRSIDALKPKEQRYEVWEDGRTGFGVRVSPKGTKSWLYMYRFNRGPLRWLGIVPACGLLIQGMAYLLDRIDKTEQWTWMYLVVARKRD